MNDASFITVVELKKKMNSDANLSADVCTRGLLIYMSTKRKILLWIGMISSVPLGCYSFLCAIFYAWRNAADPVNWPSDKAAVWCGGSLILTLIFIFAFIYCMISLIKHENKKN